MSLIKGIPLFLVITLLGPSRAMMHLNHVDAVRPVGCFDQNRISEDDTTIINEALISTRFSDLEALKEVVRIEYRVDKSVFFFSTPEVKLSQCSNGRMAISVMQAGVDEGDFRNARDGNFLDKVYLGFQSPFAVLYKDDILRVFNMGRRRREVFGPEDVAFYDLAEASLCNIHEKFIIHSPPQDTSEKGYISTFNHITAQALITSIFSEKLADYIADVHERFHMPQVLTGLFTSEQLTDPKNNAIDNYVDMINNEWGQELGKKLKRKHGITRNTEWTAELLSAYLNDVQAYYSWAFRIQFIPFRNTDPLMVKFAAKMRLVMEKVPQ